MLRTRLARLGHVPGLSERRHQSEHGKRGFGGFHALVALRSTSPGDRLLGRFAREHPKSDRDSPRAGSLLYPNGDRRGEMTVVCRFAFDDGAEADDARIQAGCCQAICGEPAAA